MTGLKELLRKKEKIAGDDRPATAPEAPPMPEFKIIRTTTESEEIVEPPDYPDVATDTPISKEKKRMTLGFRRSSNAGLTKDPTAVPEQYQGGEKGGPLSPTAVNKKGGEKRFSDMFHRHRDRSRSASGESSVFLPDELPEAPAPSTMPTADKAGGPGGGKETANNGSTTTTTTNIANDKAAQEQREAQWEKRATILAQSNPLRDLEPQQLAANEAVAGETDAQRAERRRSRSHSPSISNARGDNNIQEAIRLHELGELTLSTAMFGRLADPRGGNNALAQVLYGLALRHGWGLRAPEPERAIHYLSLAAANSAEIEEQALASGMRKGGAAKGELVLAIFELANCFRFGWGVKKDPVAARQYYETAANLGDTDAMDAAAWCYMEGFGGGKDKSKAAQYLRLAEEKGVKSVGTSWIWKEKYNPK